MIKNIFKKSPILLSFVCLFLSALQINANYLAVGGKKKILVFETKTGKWKQEEVTKPRYTIKFKRGSISDIAFHPDGTQLAFSLNGHQRIRPFDNKAIIKIRNLKTKKTRKICDETGDHITSIAFSPKGKYLAATFQRTGKIMIWNTKTGKPEKELTVDPPLQYGSMLHSAAFSHDGKYLAIGGPDTWIWDTNTWKLEKKLEGNAETRTLAFSPTEEILATGHGNHITKIWCAKTWKLLYNIKDKKVQPESITFNQRGNYLAYVGKDEQNSQSPVLVRVLKKENKGWKNAHPLISLKGATGFLASSVAFIDPKGKSLALASGDVPIDQHTGYLKIYKAKAKNWKKVQFLVSWQMSFSCNKTVFWAKKESKKEKIAKEDLQERIRFLKNKLDKILEEKEQLQKLGIQLRNKTLNIPKFLLPEKATKDLEGLQHRITEKEEAAKTLETTIKKLEEKL